MTVGTEVIQNYLRVTQNICQSATTSGRDPEKIKLLAVSKKQPVTVIQELINQYPGILIGENYVQEFADKSAHLHGDFQSHLIGPLQSNKVKKAVTLFDVIQSVGTFKIASLISKEAGKINKIQRIYLQVNISEDSDKSGFAPAELPSVLAEISGLPNLEIIGLMTITKYYSNVTDVLPDFHEMVRLKKVLSADYGQLLVSMGMSADYELAVQAGADLVRVGTDIFGLRNG